MGHHVTLVVLGISCACAHATKDLPEMDDGGSPGVDAVGGVRPPDAASAPNLPDAAGGGGGLTPDANLGTAQCRGTPMITGLPLQQAFREAQPEAPAGWYVHALSSRLDGTQTYDSFQIELWDGYGVYQGVQAHAGSFTISGEETAAMTCGVCLFLRADFDPNTGEFAQIYLAQSGQVTVTSVTGTVAGSISNAQFIRLDANFNPVGDCQSSLSGPLVFNAPVQSQ